MATYALLGSYCALHQDLDPQTDCQSTAFPRSSKHLSTAVKRLAPWPPGLTHVPVTSACILCRVYQGRDASLSRNPGFFAWKWLHYCLSLFLPRSVAPKPTTGLSNPLFYMRDSSLPDKRRPPGTPEVVCTNQPLRPTVTPKRPPPAVSTVLWGQRYCCSWG